MAAGEGPKGVTINYVAGSVMQELDIDATVSQQHSGENEITEHPVENGTNIVDHVRVKPDKLTIECWVSDTPISGEASVPGSPLSSLAYQQLLAFKTDGQLLTVTTTLRTYTSMVITSLSVPRDAKTGKALHFTCTFEQIITVSNQTVAISTTPRSQPKQNLGPKTPQLAADQTGNASFIKASTNFLGATNVGSGAIP